MSTDVEIERERASERERQRDRERAREAVLADGILVDLSLNTTLTTLARSLTVSYELLIFMFIFISTLLID